MGKFTDVEGESVQFRSAWKTQAESQTVSTITVDVNFEEISTQTVACETQETQTEALSTQPQTSQDYNDLDSEMLDFIEKSGDLMLEELKKSSSSSAFEGVGSFDGEKDEENAMLHVLSFDIVAHFLAGGVEPEDNESIKALECTGVSWNATGSVLAVSYGRFDHSGWCNYRAALCLWNVFSPKFDATKPDLILETPSGLTTVACHPVIPSIVAAGSFSGEVLIWNTALNDEVLVASTSIGDYFHREPISKLVWIYDVDSKDYRLASISGDGKVLIWTLKNKMKHPIRGFLLANKSESNSIPMGGTSIAVNPTNKSTIQMVIGSEGGALFRCSAPRNSNGKASFDTSGRKWSSSAKRVVESVNAKDKPDVVRHIVSYAKQQGIRDIDLSTLYASKPPMELMYSNAVDFNFERHTGPVNDLSWSPFHRNLFLSCSVDGSIRLHHVLQGNALLTFEPANAYIYSVCWSRTRPMVFAAAGNDGKVYIYDLSESTTSPASVLQTDDGAKTSQYCIDFNPRQRNFLAVAEGNGFARIWKLRWKLSNMYPSELSDISSLADQAQQDDESK